MDRKAGSLLLCVVCMIDYLTTEYYIVDVFQHKCRENVSLQKSGTCGQSLNKLNLPMNTSWVHKVSTEKQTIRNVSLLRCDALKFKLAPVL